MPSKTRIFIISNMYPSKKNVRYGIFVKNFENAIKEEFLVKKIVLTKKIGIIRKAIGYFVLYFKMLTLFFTARGEDIIYVHFPLHVAPALALLSLKQKKIILNFHGSDLVFDSYFTKLLSFFLLPLLRKSHIVVPSNYFKEKFINEFNIPNYHITVYPSGGINRKIFYPLKRTINNTFTLGYVSNFIPEKGWEVFLGAIKIIKKENLINNFEIIMVGDGPDKDKMDRRGRATDLCGQYYTNKTQNQLWEIYNKLDVFIFPTHRESLGLVGLEAMACGVPVIASNVDGPREYVKDNFNGFLFEKNNIEDLVDKILVYYRLPQTKRNILSMNCEQTATLYDSSTAQSSLIDFLHHV